LTGQETQQVQHLLRGDCGMPPTGWRSLRLKYLYFLYLDPRRQMARSLLYRSDGRCADIDAGPVEAGPGTI
jgi:hypothetical protein